MVLSGRWRRFPAPVAAVCDRRFFFLEIPALIERRYSALSIIFRSSSVIPYNS